MEALPSAVVSPFTMVVAISARSWWPVTLRCATTHTGDQAAAELSQLGQVQSLTPEPVKDKGVLSFDRAACDGRG